MILSQFITAYPHLSQLFVANKSNRKWKFRVRCLITSYHIYAQFYHSLSHLIYTNHNILRPISQMESESAEFDVLSHLITSPHVFITAYHTLSTLITQLQREKMRSKVKVPIKIPYHALSHVWPVLSQLITLYLH